MRLRALACAAIAAFIALTSTTRTAALGRPGITPVPCPDQAWQLGDPTFDALPGAKAYFGQYDGGIYKIEIPDTWNGERSTISPPGCTRAPGPRATRSTAT